MTNKVEIYLHLRLETKCGFVQTEIGNGVKLKYYRDHTYCRMNEGVPIEETESR